MYSFEKRTSLTIMLPYGSERTAVTKSYNFRITFTHESGTETVLEGESGNAGAGNVFGYNAENLDSIGTKYEYLAYHTEIYAG